MNQIAARKRQRGFTLIEILIVIGIIAILATIVIIAINPSRQFKQARDTQRVSNVNTILNAIGQRIADNKGTFAGAVTGTTQTCPNIATTGTTPLTAGTDYAIWSGTGGSGNWIDLSCLVPTYIPSFVSDPSTGTGNNTGYVLNVDASGRDTVKATGELTTPITVTR